MPWPFSNSQGQMLQRPLSMHSKEWLPSRATFANGAPKHFRIPFIQIPATLLQCSTCIPCVARCGSTFEIISPKRPVVIFHGPTVDSHICLTLTSLAIQLRYSFNKTLISLTRLLLDILIAGKYFRRSSDTNFYARFMVRLVASQTPTMMMGWIVMYFPGDICLMRTHLMRMTLSATGIGTPYTDTRKGSQMKPSYSCSRVFANTSSPCMALSLRIRYELPFLPPGSIQSTRTRPRVAWPDSPTAVLITDLKSSIIWVILAGANG